MQKLFMLPSINGCADVHRRMAYLVRVVNAHPEIPNFNPINATSSVTIHKWSDRDKDAHKSGNNYK